MLMTVNGFKIAEISESNLIAKKNNKTVMKKRRKKKGKSTTKINVKIIMIVKRAQKMMTRMKMRNMIKNIQMIII